MSSSSYYICKEYQVTGKCERETCKLFHEPMPDLGPMCNCGCGRYRVWCAAPTRPKLAKYSKH